jgi:tRNA pseudouridine38-40 synthase
MTKYKAVVEYDGTDYIGFQRQAPERGQTVQGELEVALADLNQGNPVTVLAAGRTDTGVHALGQVIAFNLEWRHGPQVLVKAVNAHLSTAISVRAVEECPAEFHPRFAARGRRYRYRLYQAPVRSPLQERFAWQVWPQLDVAALVQASEYLLGRKDFAAFGSAPDEGGHTVREIREARWEQNPTGDVLDFYIAADAFLYRMVRSIVGTLKKVGAGDLAPQQFGDIVASANRGQGANIAPPNGLCLLEVIY